VRRIERAIDKCYSSLDVVPTVPVSEVVVAVVNAIASKFDFDVPNVEAVQDLVEIALLNAGEFEAARHYIIYRATRSRARVVVPDEVKAAFDLDAEYFPTEAQRFMFYDKYSRYSHEAHRRETWPETVRRNVDYLRHLAGGRLSEDVFDRIYEGILTMQVMPSMRSLSQAGPAAIRNSIAIFNCSFTGVSDMRSFTEGMLLSMGGAGVGFSVERRFVEEFPRIKRQTGLMLPPHVIEDSTEGWAAALQIGLETWFDGNDIRFDPSLVRPAGSVLLTKGGRSSGEDPLLEVLAFCRSKILSRQGSFLRTLDCHDMMCVTLGAAVSGGVRRTAAISLFDWDDVEMRTCKTGGGLDANPWRWNANNSAVWPVEGVSQLDLMDQMMEMARSKRGEPGIFSRESAKLNAPARRVITDTAGQNPCVTGDTLVAVADGRGEVSIAELASVNADVPVYALDDDQRLAVRMMRAPRKTASGVPVYRVTLDDGSSVRATAQHKFLTKDSGYVAVEDLHPGDRLHIMIKYLSTFAEVFGNASTAKTSQDYWWVNNGRAQNYLEHRYVAEFHYGRPVGRGETVHHKDFDAMNNSPENLVIMTKVDHDELHKRTMVGDSNPMRRAHTEWSEEQWVDYRSKQSLHSLGDANKNYSGYTHDELSRAADDLTRVLGRRPSIAEWQDYAAERGMPQNFSGWRKNHLGGMRGFLKAAALRQGFDYFDADPRTLKRLQSALDDGYDAEILDGTLVFNKVCEVCEMPFVARLREHGVCGSSCAAKRMWVDHGDVILDGMVAHYAERKSKLREDQAMVFNRASFDLGRPPMKAEWVEACKAAGVSFEISRKSSPFRYWAELSEYASAANHIVVAVEPDGEEDVYNGTVDDFHNFFVGGFECLTRNGKRKVQFINNRQCGEVILRDKGLCNLSIAVSRHDDTYETLLDKVTLATIIGTLQSMATTYPGLRDEWRINAEEERLLGVDITGQQDCPLLLADTDGSIRRSLRDAAVVTNEKYADLLGINHSAAVTCNKPSGNSSLLLDCSSGIHRRWAPFYIRRARVSSHTPVYRVLLHAGVPMRPENGQTAANATTWVISFPIKAPEGSKGRKGYGAIEQCEFWLVNKMHWTELNPSVTITYEPDEMLALTSWVWEHREVVGGMAFLPADDAQYAQMPFEEITEAEYEVLAAEFPVIDWSLLSVYEESDMTDAAQTLACLSGSCDI